MTRRLLEIVVAAGILLPGCGGDETPFAPTVENVSGSYQATSLTASQAGLTTDLLTLGATITVTLNPNGTSEGRLFAPGLGELGENLDVDLAGTWTLSGETVTFNQEGDSFIRDVPFTAEPNRLRGEGTFDGFTIRVVLTRQV